MQVRFRPYLHFTAAIGRLYRLMDRQPAGRLLFLPPQASDIARDGPALKAAIGRHRLMDRLQGKAIGPTNQSRIENLSHGASHAQSYTYNR